ncbi:hypothetical protein OW763_13940 [Clostridium aestuarii]|uniref:Uncharacterized protein n=1 Tax=Clostridium aestuarii TaxID=338193 RepID=A0ABT4D2F1_9CLOT|nr:hypothetical protein [Clostridium aestuarii]MCY6485431.1 hypothetical protein [Clostridium aestuarii]
MKVKSWSKYFVFIFLILVIVFGGQYILEGIRKNAQATYIIPWYLSVIMIIFYVSIGLLMGLEHLICEIKKEGTWAINLPKIVLMGLPSLYFSLTVFICYSNNQFVRNVWAYPIGILIKNTTIISVFQLILGYSIITSFYKHNEKM